MATKPVRRAARAKRVAEQTTEFDAYQGASELLLREISACSDAAGLFAICDRLRKSSSFQAPGDTVGMPAAIREIWAAMRRIGENPPPVPSVVNVFDDNSRAFVAAITDTSDDCLAKPGDVLAAFDEACRWCLAELGSDTDQRRQKFVHSDDFSSVQWFGNLYSFTPAQSHVVQVLWKNWEKGTPDVKQETLIEAAGISSDRISNVFRPGGTKHPAFGVMIQKGKTRSSFRLVEITKT